MHVTPQGCAPEGSITGQELTYRIDFQNLGAGPAHDVVLTDALDSDLDPAALRLLDASHAITGFQVDDQGELVVRFDDIEFPAEVVDAAASMGHVTIAISPLEPYVDAAVVENSASIVFDANAPVVTNTVTSSLYHGDPVPVADFTATPNGNKVATRTPAAPAASRWPGISAPRQRRGHRRPRTRRESSTAVRLRTPRCWLRPRPDAAPKPCSQWMSPATGSGPPRRSSLRWACAAAASVRASA